MRLNAEDVVAQRSAYETALSEEFTSLFRARARN